MAEEVGIVMKLYDQVSPSLKSIAGNTKAFDKNMDDLEESLKAYEKAQDTLTGKLNDLKKAMETSTVKVSDARKEYRKLKDETSKGALDDAIDEQTRLRREMEETRAVIQSNAAAYKNLYKEAGAAAAAESRFSNRAGDGSGIFSALGKAGIMNMVGDAAGQWANVMVGSTLGSSAGSVFSSALSGAVSGAAMGSLAGPIGTAVGAAIGGGVGLLSGGSQVFQERDEAFKSYVQESTQNQLEEMASDIASGSATASQRELDLIAFNKLLGDGVGGEYLNDLRTMAAATPMEYSDLTTMSRALATGFGDSPDRMLALMTGIGNAGSAVGVDASGMATMAQALSRMQSSGKTSLEYLNMFQERGIDVIGMLASSLGVSQGQVYEMISDGDISGRKAVDIIQQGLEQYAGAMDEMSKTFSGLESTLADAQTEMDNAYGEGYNETRKQGLQEEIDYLSGESGALIQEANRALGAWQAELENSKEQYIRDAMDEVLNSDEYKAAMAAGTDEGYAEAGRMLMEAKVRGMNEYNSSEGAQLMVSYEMSMAEAIRDDTATNDAYWDAGYRKGQEYSKGFFAARSGQNPNVEYKSWMDPDSPDYDFTRYFTGTGDAFGLDRVPRNGLYYLHQDERVQTAQEARSDRNVRPIQITITGNNFGAGATAEEIAQRLADSIERKMAAGVLP